ncbi:hypothetical protein KAI68_03625, partial [bacterium]|nr:hypothetical protein [bacterium]
GADIVVDDLEEIANILISEIKKQKAGKKDIEDLETVTPTESMKKMKYIMDLLGLKEYTRQLGIMMNALDVRAFVGNLIKASGKSEEEVLNILMNIPDFKEKALKYKELKAKENKELPPEESTNKCLEIYVTKDEAKITSDYQPLEEGEDRPLSNLIMEKFRKALNTIFPYRDDMDKYVGRFLGFFKEKPDVYKEEKINDQELSDLREAVDKIRDFMLGAENIDLEEIVNLINNGIGANEMYLQQIAKDINEIAKYLDIDFHWEVVDNPADFPRVERNCKKITRDNTLSMHMSRSGGTTEPGDLFEMIMNLIMKHIVWANKGRFKELGKKIKEKYPKVAAILHIDNTPGNIGGRHMNLKTDMVYGPLFTAFLIMGYKKFKKESDKNTREEKAVEWAEGMLKVYVENLYKANQDLSPKQEDLNQAVNNAGSQLAIEAIRKRDVEGRVKLGMVFDPGLRDFATEFFQNTNEGICKPAPGKERNNNMHSFCDAREDYMTTFKGKPELYQATFIVDMSSEFRHGMLRKAKELESIGVPVKVVKLDRRKKKEGMDEEAIEALFKHNLAVQAQATALLQTMVTTFTHITDQDSNSNPAVKTTREITAVIQDIFVKLKASIIKAFVRYILRNIGNIFGVEFRGAEINVRIEDIKQKMEEAKAEELEKAKKEIAPKIAQVAQVKAKQQEEFESFINDQINTLVDNFGLDDEKKEIINRFRVSIMAQAKEKQKEGLPEEFENFVGNAINKLVNDLKMVEKDREMINIFKKLIIAQAKARQQEELPKEFQNFADNTINKLADDLGMGNKKGEVVNVFMGSISRANSFADTVESGGLKSAFMDAAVEEDEFLNKTIGSLTKDFALTPLSKQVEVYRKSGIGISVACREDISNEQEKGYKAGTKEEAAESVANYLYDLFTTENRDKTLNTFGMAYMDADTGNEDIVAVMAEINKQLAKFGINALPMNFPRIAHTGIEAAQALAEIMAIIALLPKQSFPEGKGEFGSTEIRDGLTVNDGNYIYILANVVRMALGGSPTVMIDYKNKEQLPEIREILVKALGLFAEKVAKGAEEIEVERKDELPSDLLKDEEAISNPVMVLGLLGLFISIYVGVILGLSWGIGILGLGLGILLLGGPVVFDRIFDNLARNPLMAAMLIMVANITLPEGKPVQLEEVEKEFLTELIAFLDTKQKEEFKISEIKELFEGKKDSKEVNKYLKLLEKKGIIEKIYDSETGRAKPGLRKLSISKQTIKEDFLQISSGTENIEKEIIEHIVKERIEQIKGGKLEDIAKETIKSEKVLDLIADMVVNKKKDVSEIIKNEDIKDFVNKFNDDELNSFFELVLGDVIKESEAVTELFKDYKEGEKTGIENIGLIKEEIRREGMVVLAKNELFMKFLACMLKEINTMNEYQNKALATIIKSMAKDEISEKRGEWLIVKKLKDLASKIKEKKKIKEKPKIVDLPEDIKEKLKTVNLSEDIKEKLLTEELLMKFLNIGLYEAYEKGEIDSHKADILTKNMAIFARDYLSEEEYFELNKIYPDNKWAVAFIEALIDLPKMTTEDKGGESKSTEQLVIAFTEDDMYYVKEGIVEIISNNLIDLHPQQIKKIADLIIKYDGNVGKILDASGMNKIRKSMEVSEGRVRKGSGKFIEEESKQIRHEVFEKIKLVVTESIKKSKVIKARAIKKGVVIEKPQKTIIEEDNAVVFDINDVNFMREDRHYIGRAIDLTRNDDSKYRLIHQRVMKVGIKDSIVFMIIDINKQEDINTILTDSEVKNSVIFHTVTEEDLGKFIKAVIKKAYELKDADEKEKTARKLEIKKDKGKKSPIVTAIEVDGRKEEESHSILGLDDIGDLKRFLRRKSQLRDINKDIRYILFSEAIIKDFLDMGLSETANMVPDQKNKLAEKMEKHEKLKDIKLPVRWPWAFITAVSDIVKERETGVDRIMVKQIAPIISEMKKRDKTEEREPTLIPESVEPIEVKLEKTPLEQFIDGYTKTLPVILPTAYKEGVLLALFIAARHASLLDSLIKQKLKEEEINELVIAVIQDARGIKEYALIILKNKHQFDMDMEELNKRLNIIYGTHPGLKTDMDVDFKEVNTIRDNMKKYAGFREAAVVGINRINVEGMSEGEIKEQWEREELDKQEEEVERIWGFIKR